MLEPDFDEGWTTTTCGLMERISGEKATSRLEEFGEGHKEVVNLGVMLTRKQGGWEVMWAKYASNKKWDTEWDGGNACGQGYRKKRRCQAGRMR
jgi:hypothetical protein